MSGIVGIFRRDGAPASPALVRPMLEAIAHRGPDRAAVWADGPVAFGNCVLFTTPESLWETLPSRDPGTPFTIAADARIDNRDELREALGIREAAITDSSIILRAYERWGEDCPHNLIGDFSFVIWDEKKHKLFCARDSAGMRSFYYYATPNLFAFASEIKALRELRQIPIELNETRIGDYLSNIYEDRAITFYKDIFRLPPATALSVTPSEIEARTYWKLDPGREIILRDDAEYAEAFKEHFDTAVKCRLRSAFPVGSALSGGLDSSAIACTARNMLGAPLHTFSIVFPGLPAQDLKVIDERVYINRVLDTGNFIPHTIHGDELSPMADLTRVHHHLDEANSAPNLYLHWAMYGAAKDNGVRVFLDGLDGDTTVSHGFEYLQELARKLRFRRLHGEAKLLAQNLFGGSKPRRVLWNYCLKEMVPDWVFETRSLLLGKSRSPKVASLVDRQLTTRLDLARRAKRLRPAHKVRTARANHHKALTFALYPQALEMADKASAAFGVEARYPFFDRRLIEFCLALPATQKLGCGWNRLVFRRAMEGVLPPEIQWRGSKGNLSPNFCRKLLDFDGATLDRVVAQQTARSYVDGESMRRALNEYRAAPMAAGANNSVQLFAAANLALWLEQTRIGRANHA